MEKQTLVEQTTQRLLEMIQREGYGPGDKLPTETELVRRLGVGRNTVREALRSLASRNVVTVRQGAGTFISEKNGVADDPLGFAMMEDPEKLTRDLLQIRVMLEPPIAALAAQNRGRRTWSGCGPCWRRSRGASPAGRSTPSWTPSSTPRLRCAATTQWCPI